jgi:hypothetical protein
MGYHDHDDEKRSRISIFIENLICGFMAFASCIGGWLVHFGMNLWWMLGLSTAIASIFAWCMAKH